MNTSAPLFHKPKSILAARNILYASMFLAIVSWIINEASGWMPGSSFAEVLVILLVTLLVTFVLTVQIGLGKKWARTLLLVLFIVGAIPFLYVLPRLFTINVLAGTLSLLQLILNILIIRYLFARESTLWFGKVHEAAQHPLPEKHEG